MGDASEAFDELLTILGKYIDTHMKTRDGRSFKNIVGFELYKQYICECNKKIDFILDPN
jgi:hypothetical protein